MTERSPKTLSIISDNDEETGGRRGSGGSGNSRSCEENDRNTFDPEIKSPPMENHINEYSKTADLDTTCKSALDD